jgi:hypothetical protein
MPDDPTKKHPPEPRRINVHDEYVVRYWTKKFHAGEEKSHTMIKNVTPGSREKKPELDQ